MNRPMIEDVSMIGVGMSSDGSCGLLASVTVATELVMLGVSGKMENPEKLSLLLLLWHSNVLTLHCDFR